MIYISFTGHRDKKPKKGELERVYKLLQDKFPGEKLCFIEGGAVGADTAVQYFCANNGIDNQTIYPNYSLYGKRAALLRNEVIVNRGELLVACYDGRKTGGTYFTIEYAKSLGREIIYLESL